MTSVRKNHDTKFSKYLVLVGFSFLLGSTPALLNLIVDPYELLIDRDRPNKTTEIAEKAHYPLWKLGGYHPGKYETIILGDSRARALREKYWNSFEFSATKNLAYGGGTIPEIYETFKLIRKDPKVKRLVIGMQLRSFDEDHKQGMNRVPEAISLIDSGVKYFFNWSIAKTSLKVAEKELQPLKDWLDSVPLGPSSARAADVELISSEAFIAKDLLSAPNSLEAQPARILPSKFARQIAKNARSDWQSFDFSERYWSLIENIGRWAKDNDKEVIFVIPPTIVEMQNTIADYGHQRLNIALRERLALFGTVFDFDYSHELTRSLDNFSDAYHFNAKVARQIVGEVVAYVASDKQVLQRVAKRRKAISCNGLIRSIRASEIGSLSLETGSNCRVWRFAAL